MIGNWAGAGSREKAKTKKQKAAKPNGDDILIFNSDIFFVYSTPFTPLEISIWLSLRCLKLMPTTEVWISLHTLVFSPHIPLSVNGFIFHSLLKQKLESSY